MLLLDWREGRAVEGREGAVAVREGRSSCGCGGGEDGRLAPVRVGGSSWPFFIETGEGFGGRL